MAVLERCARAVEAGEDPGALREPARAAAHQLAGALGTYGRRGSDEALELQELLRGGDLGDPAVADRLRGLVGALRDAVSD